MTEVQFVSLYDVWSPKINRNLSITMVRLGEEEEEYEDMMCSGERVTVSYIQMSFKTGRSDMKQASSRGMKPVYSSRLVRTASERMHAALGAEKIVK